MKQITLKKINNFDYKEFFVTLLKTAPVVRGISQGMSIDEVRKSVKVLNLLDQKSENEVLELEDADFEHLFERVNKSTYNIATQELVELFNDLEEARKNG